MIGKYVVKVGELTNKKTKINKRQQQIMVGQPLWGLDFFFLFYKKKKRFERYFFFGKCSFYPND
jgi:hypothetical protein